MSRYAPPPEVEKALDNLVSEASTFTDDPDEYPWKLRCIIRAYIEALAEERDEWRLRFRHERDVWNYPACLEEAQAERDRYKAAVAELIDLMHEGDSEGIRSTLKAAEEATRDD